MFFKRVDFRFALIAASLVVGLLYVLPHFLRYHELSGQGRNYIAWTQKAEMDMANVHAGRYREIVDGNLWATEIDTIEHKTGPAMWPMLSALIFAPFLLLTKSITATVIITDFIFPPLLMLAFFLIINSFTQNKYFSLFASFLLTIFPQISVLIPPASLGELENVVRHLVPFVLDNKVVTNLTYLRRDAFIPAGPFFILAFYFIYETLSSENKRKKIFTILAGLGYGLCFYFYIYYWLFLSVFLGVLFLSFLMIKNKKKAQDIILIVLAGLVVSVPFWINHYLLTRLPQYNEITARAGLEIGRAFRFGLWKSYLLVIFLVGLVAWLGIKFKKNISVMFLVAIGLSQILVLNLQVFTGFNLQSDHWSTRVFVIVNGFILSLIVYWLSVYLLKFSIVNKWQKWFKVIGVILIFFVLSNTVSGLLQTEKTSAVLYSMPDNVMQAYSWLNKNTLKDSVILSLSIETNIDLPIYTHNRIFLSRAPTTIGSEEEIIERLFIASRIFGLRVVDLDRILHDRDAVRYFFSQSYDSRSLDTYLGSSDYTYYVLPTGKITDITNDYNKYKIKNNLPYNLDFIFVGPKDGEINNKMGHIKDYELIYNQGDIKIFKVVY